jgi:hypothetical protein
MGLWSIHPFYLDQKALVAVWREGLLARAVLRGLTRGYTQHPQLLRFRAHQAPVSAINSYLRSIAVEAKSRGYRFNVSKLGPVRNREQLTVTSGQLKFEMEHLRNKVQARAPAELSRLPDSGSIQPHPLFMVRNGQPESWEKGAV